jgi:D-serine deaminase-like pyridoxal phosphate-dependent protein
MGRCGVLSPEAALALARRAVDAPGLDFLGLMGYEGHLVSRPGRQERAAGVEAAMVPLRQAVQLIEQDGIPVRIVSGGGTGTYDMTGSSEPMTEIQAGSYVVMDTTYRRVRPEFTPALTVLSTVVSRPLPGRIVTDAGLKSMTKEFGWPEPIDAGPITVHGLSEEHGRLATDAPQQVCLRPGDRIRFIPSHCCTTINLHDRLYAVRGERLVDIWPIAARGRAQ